jgi:hypothetical protein
VVVLEDLLGLQAARQIDLAHEHIAQIEIADGIAIV